MVRFERNGDHPSVEWYCTAMCRFFVSVPSGPLSLAVAFNKPVVWVNSPNVRDLRTPFGGMKHSGIGREGGRRGQRQDEGRGPGKESLHGTPCASWVG